MKKLSIIIPVYNEEATLKAVLERVVSVKYLVPFEVIIVNDGSRDRSGVIAEKFVQGNKSARYISHEKNQGKGAAVRTGAKAASGDYLIIQDADLEYDPQDIVRLIRELGNHPKDAVIYGSRLMQPPVLFGPDKTPLLLHYFGNRFLSLVTSLLYGEWITDMETCFKLIPASFMQTVKLNARGFELEPELTAKLLKGGYDIFEISIQTKPRGFDEGKKLRTFYDGRKALWALIKYRFTN